MKLTGDHNQCPSCEEYFNSSSSFDMHRIGAFNGEKSLKKLGPRRCMTVPEMEKKGMSKNPGGWWMTETRADRAARSDASSLGYPPTNSEIKTSLAVRRGLE